MAQRCKGSGPRSSPRCRRSRCAPARSTSARASPTPTARPSCSRPRASAIARRASTSTRPGRGIAGAAAGDRRRTSARFYGLDVRPRHRGAGHHRGDRGDRRRVLALRRARRRGGRARAVLRLVRRRRSRWPARRPASVTLRAARLPARPRRAARRRSARGPGCCWSTPRTTRPARCSTATSSRAIAELAVEHDLLVVTDEVYEHLVFDGAEHVPMATLPGHGASGRSRSPRPARRSRSPAGRSAGRWARRSWSPRCARRSSSSPTSRGAVPAGDRARRSTPRRRLARGARDRPAGQAGPAVRRAARGGFDRVPAAGHVLRDAPTSGRSATTTAPSSAGRCRSAAAWSPIPH